MSVQCFKAAINSFHLNLLKFIDLLSSGKYLVISIHKIVKLSCWGFWESSAICLKFGSLSGFLMTTQTYCPLYRQYMYRQSVFESSIPCSSFSSTFIIYENNSMWSMNLLYPKMFKCKDIWAVSLANRKMVNFE